MNRPHLVKDATTGLVSFLVLGLVIWLCLALYSQAFRSYDVITVEADRTGLLMDPGADVKLHGVVVGRVGEVTADQDGATLTLEVDKGRLAEIPADATVRIVPPTVFGAKYVELRTATAPGGPALEPGTVISGARVTVEINQTFDAARQMGDRPLAPFGETRRDWLLQGSVSVYKRDWNLGGFAPSLCLSVSRNFSSLSLYDEKRMRGEVRLTKAF